MWTARGTVTKIDWTQVTLEQLHRWGVKFHHLQLGKPAFDLFIDDKALNVNHWTEDNVKGILKII
jgi:CMP-N,N'-diacetyllegionaminic acid synthase